MRWHTALIALSLLGTACVGARRRSDTTIVRRIRVHGLGGLPLGERNRHAIRDQMVQASSGKMVLTWPGSVLLEPIAFRPQVLHDDEDRLETWLAHRGWFEAQVDLAVRQVRRDRRKRAGVVDLVATIERGPRTRWGSAPMLTGSLPETLPESMALAGSMVRTRRPFRLDEALATGEWIEHLSGDLGYRNTEAEMELVVDLSTHEASVQFDIQPGTAARFGAPLVEVDAPESVLSQLTSLVPGERYNRTQIHNARDALLATGAFDAVQVDSVLDGTVAKPRIRGTLGPPRHIAAGGRFGFINGILQPELHGSWSHDNLAGKLDRVSVSGEIGVAVPLGTRQPVPIAGVRLGSVIRDVRGAELQPTIRVQQRLFQYALPRFDATAELPATWELAPHLELELRPQLRFTRMGLGEQELWILALGPDATRQYGVGGAKLAAIFDRTRPIVARTQGTRLRVATGASLTSLGQPLLEAGADLRLYGAPRRPLLGKPLQLLARLDLRGITSPGPIPWPETLFLGGGDDFRGFRGGQVGVYDTVCVKSPFAVNAGFDPDGDIDRLYIPRGGSARALGAVEAELQRVGPAELDLAVFAEAGWLESSGVHGAFGVGARYETGIGPIRVDLAIRPLAAEDAGPGLGGSGVNYCDASIPPRRRAFDLISEFDRYTPLDRSFPAVNLFISLGRPI